MHPYTYNRRIFFFFFFNDTATTEIYTYCHTLSLHDALPIYQARQQLGDGLCPCRGVARRARAGGEKGRHHRPRRGNRIGRRTATPLRNPRSEEHTSELQSLMRISYAVFCLTKKKTTTTQTHNTFRIVAQ